MKLSQEVKLKICQDYHDWFEYQYAGKTPEERKELAQFFTPADITIEMIEKYPFEEFGNRTILDPSCGSGNLLVACIIAGAKPENCYGNDYDPIMVELCRERLSKFEVPINNIHQGNALISDCVIKKNFNESYNNILNQLLKRRNGLKGGFMDNPEAYEKWKLQHNKNKVEALKIEQVESEQSNMKEEELW